MPGPLFLKEKRLPVAVCSFCKTKETELYENGFPICLGCENTRTKSQSPATDSEMRTTLLQDVLEWTSRAQDIAKQMEAVTAEARGMSQSDGTQHVKNASSQLTSARNELMKAQTRLAQYFGSWIVPGDLKRRC
jgi:hypothetical protein